ELVPLGLSVDSGADASDLHGFVHDSPVGETLDENAIRLAGREGFDASAAFRTPGGPRHRNAPHRFAASERFADEQVDMGLEKAARAELEDREFGQLTLPAARF